MQVDLSESLNHALRFAFRQFFSRPTRYTECRRRTRCVIVLSLFPNQPLEKVMIGMLFQGRASHTFKNCLNFASNTVDPQGPPVGSLSSFNDKGAVSTTW